MITYEQIAFLAQRHGQYLEEIEHMTGASHQEISEFAATMPISLGDIRDLIRFGWRPEELCGSPPSGEVDDKE